MQRVASLIHLPAARSLNLTGKGIGIAVFDTGIGRHPGSDTARQPSKSLCGYRKPSSGLL